MRLNADRNIYLQTIVYIPNAAFVCFSAIYYKQWADEIHPSCQLKLSSSFNRDWMERNIIALPSPAHRAPYSNMTSSAHLNTHSPAQTKGSRGARFFRLFLKFVVIFIELIFLAYPDTSLTTLTDFSQ